MKSKIHNRADNAQNMQAALIIANKEELEKERDVLEQIDSLMSKAVKLLEKRRIIYDRHPDVTNIKANYLKQENRVKELAASRELSEEAVKQFENNLEQLGEK